MNTRFVSMPVATAAPPKPPVTVPPPVPAPVKPKSYSDFLIICLAMGQGDCTIVRCPDGRILMIDCGSKAYLTDNLRLKAQQIIRYQKLAGTRNKIDALILTHPDRDHYNQLIQILGPWKIPDLASGQPTNAVALEVEAIYFSSVERSNSSGDSPLAYYRENKVNDAITSNGFKTNSLNEVTINATAGNYKTWVKTDGFKKVATETPIPSKVLPILWGVTDNAQKWSVSIIAGNVSPDASVEKDGTPENTGSLVTLLQIGDSKALICGDATMSTEAFLLKQHKNLIANVDIVQIPHHGSETSSSAAFVSQTNPKAAVVSVGHMETAHKLPRYSVLEKWLEALEKQNSKIAEHACDSWYRNQDEAEEAFNDWSAKKYKILTKAESGQNEPSYWYLNPIMEDNASYLITNLGYLLYREKVSVPLWQTSTLGQSERLWLWFTLPL